jgi:hypothetical protein
MYKYKYKYKYVSKYATMDQGMIPGRAKSRYRVENNPVQLRQAWTFRLKNAGITDAKLIVDYTVDSQSYQQETDVIPACESREVQIPNNVTGLITVEIWAVPYAPPGREGRWINYRQFYIDAQKATSTCYRMWPEIICGDPQGYETNMHVEQVPC